MSDTDSPMGAVAAQDSYDPFAAEQFANPMVKSAIGSLATLPQRAIQNSQYALDTGTYDPGPTLEAATLPLGTGAVAGVPVRGGEMALGAGGRTTPRRPRSVKYGLAGAAPAGLGALAAQDNYQGD